MLDLYTHEIPCPDDRAIRKFLWSDAFHDASILSLQYDNERSRFMTLRISGGGYDVRHGVYLLRFHNVKCITYAAEYSCNDRIYAPRFLDSAALHREQAESEVPLYHLRIETWNGYIDLIFERFSIRLEGGRVDYRPVGPAWEEVVSYRERWLRQKYGQLLQQTEKDEDDSDELLAYRLCFAHQELGAQAIPLARKALAQPCESRNAKPYAAYLLGLHGTAEDVGPLTQYLLALPPWCALTRRRVLDALERLHERTQP